MHSKNSPWLLIATLTVIMTLYAFAQEDETSSEESSSTTPGVLITCNGVSYKSIDDIIQSVKSDIRDFTAKLTQLQDTANNLDIGDVKQTLINPLDELALTLENINKNIDVIDSDSIASNLNTFQSLQAVLASYASAVTAIEKKEIPLPDMLVDMKTKSESCACKLTYLIRVANHGI